ncbi:Hypothetical predicted protein [Mytilus galloprovincialis]|uniref:Uncharacterized protein n=1 Tax=Mytilus galloprovincialis TaxID=29158 RepID=A0A8B6GDS4_MYTGA|nr:Hypothetical predicted protein [Mytilus galloprovincialis]
MELIRLLKRRKVKEAIKQVKDGESLNESDENGCTALHYACSEGLLDFIVAAALHGVNFEQKDKDGESALFKAVQYSKLESIVALVAFKSNVNVKNKENGQF